MVILFYLLLLLSSKKSLLFCFIFCRSLFLDFFNRVKPEHSSNDGLPNLYMGDSWFTSLTMAQELKSHGNEVIGQLKASHGGYPKDFINEHLEDAPGGVHIVLKGTLPYGQEMVATGNKYCSKKVLYFLSTPGAGSTTPGEPYEMRYTDE